MGQWVVRVILSNKIINKLKNINNLDGHNTAEWLIIPVACLFNQSYSILSQKAAVQNVWFVEANVKSIISEIRSEDVLLYT